MVAIVLLDANFLYVPLQFKVDVFEEIPRLVEERAILVLLPGTRDEIVKKNTRRPASQEARQGMAALRLATVKEGEGKLRVLEEPRRERETADEYVLRVAREIFDRGTAFGKTVSMVAVATNDKTVRQACDEAGIKVVTLRQRKYLGLS